jgi:hypothetical protein
MFTAPYNPPDFGGLRMSLIGPIAFSLFLSFGLLLGILSLAGRF